MWSLEEIELVSRTGVALFWRGWRFLESMQVLEMKKREGGKIEKPNA
jgi:hypothetical protein